MGGSARQDVYMERVCSSGNAGSPTPPNVGMPAALEEEPLRSSSRSQSPTRSRPPSSSGSCIEAGVPSSPDSPKEFQVGSAENYEVTPNLATPATLPRCESPEIQEHVESHRDSTRRPTRTHGGFEARETHVVEIPLLNQRDVGAECRQPRVLAAHGRQHSAPHTGGTAQLSGRRTQSQGAIRGNVLPLRRIVTMNRLRKVKVPALVGARRAANLTSRASSLEDVASMAQALSMGRGGKLSGETLDGRGFSVLQTLIDTAKSSPEVSLLNVSPVGSCASTLARNNSGPTARPWPRNATISATPPDSLEMDGMTLGEAATTEVAIELVKAAADSPGGSPMGSPLLITRSQLKALAPNLRDQGAHVQEMFGIRNVEDDASVLELDLNTFLPLVSLLSSGESGGARTSHEQKLAVLYRVLDTRGDEQVTLDDVRSVLNSAIRSNGLYLSDEHRAVLATIVMSRLDVDGNGVVSAQDFRLATRTWKLDKIGLPLTRSAVNRSVDITCHDHLGINIPLDDSLAGAVRGADQEDKPAAEGCATDDQTDNRSKRRSFVRASAEWLRRRASAVTFLGRFDFEVGSAEGTSEPNHQKLRSADMGSTDINPVAGTSKKDDQIDHGSPSDHHISSKWSRRLSTYLKLEGGKLLCVFAFAVITLAFCTHTFRKFAADAAVMGYFGYAVPLAKGTASIINFTLVFQFLLVCRTLLTKLRDVRWLRWIPINKHIVWHKYCGILFLVASAVHVVCHVFWTAPILARDPGACALTKLPELNLWQVMFLTVPGWTGWGLVLVSVAIGATSLARVRNKNFEAFWYTHHLFVILIALLLMHGSAGLMGSPNSWKYMIIPVVAYTAERLLRVYRSSFKLKIREALIQGDTLVLAIDKPPYIKDYVAGQVIFLNVPSVAAHEWHPFSLTSCPGDPLLTLRIKRCGDWTSRLFTAVEPLATLCAANLSIGQPPQPTPKQVTIAQGGGVVVQRSFSDSTLPVPPPTAATGNTWGSTTTLVSPAGDAEHMMKSFFSMSSVIAERLRSSLEVCVDGVFGAPSQTFFEHDHVIFVATGVGCTPFLSILNQIQHLVKNEMAERRLSRCKSLNVAGPPGTVVRRERPLPVKRIDFYWLNRDQEGFKWMSEALHKVDPQVLRVLRIHTFLTCAKGGNELNSFLLWWGLELAKKRQGGRCLLTGMQNSSVFWGRPHWESIFRQSANLFPNKKVGVYFCGPKALGKELYHTIRHMNATSETFFEFSKENF